MFERRDDGMPIAVLHYFGNINLTRPFPLHEHIHGVVEGTGADEFTGIDEEDFVGILDGIEPVGDDDAGSGGR